MHGACMDLHTSGFMDSSGVGDTGVVPGESGQVKGGPRKKPDKQSHPDVAHSLHSCHPCEKFTLGFYDYLLHLLRLSVLSATSSFA